MSIEAIEAIEAFGWVVNRKVLVAFCTANGNMPTIPCQSDDYYKLKGEEETKRREKKTKKGRSRRERANNCL